MRAHERRGISRWQVQVIANERFTGDAIAEFIQLSWLLRRERQYLSWRYKPRLYEFVGPLEFNGPLYDGQPYVGSIVAGRILNTITMIDYVCARGMLPEVFAERIAYCRRVLDSMRRCRRPNLPH